jgi:hypothetical protein
VQLTNKVALRIVLDARFFHRLVEHLRMRFASKGRRSIIAKRHAFEQIIDSQEFHHPLSMSDIRVCEQPHPDLASVDVFQELAEFRIGFDDVLEGQRIVDLAVVLERIDLMMAD